MTEKLRKYVSLSFIVLYSVIMIFFHSIRIVKYIDLMALAVVLIIISIIYIVTNKPLNKKSFIIEIISNVIMFLVIFYILLRIVNGI